MTPRLLALAGSMRRDSYNDRLVRIAVRGAREAGAEVTHVRMGDLPVPVYDADLEEAEGMPANVLEWKRLFKSHEGMLISTPEYNSMIPGAFKNLLDWISRPVPDERPFEPFRGKVVSLMSASDGSLAAIRGLTVVRALLCHLQMIVLPDVLGIKFAGEAFDEKGNLADPKMQEIALRLGKNAADMVRQLQMPVP